MRFLLGLGLSLLLAGSVAAEDCFRQRQVLRVVQQPVYQLDLGGHACGASALRQYDSQNVVFAIEGQRQRAGFFQQLFQPRLQLRSSHGSQLRLSNGQRLRIERGGLFGLRQRIVID